MTGSYCLLSAMNKVGSTNEEVGKIGKEDLLKLINVSELKDCENLVSLFNNNFFEKEKYNWEEFKGKFEDLDDGFGWIFSSKGIRRKLEENNV